MNKLLIILALISIASCSNKVMYNNLRLNQQQKCAEEPRNTRYECMERTDKPYKDYERERKELLKS